MSRKSYRDYPTEYFTPLDAIRAGAAEHMIIPATSRAAAQATRHDLNRFFRKMADEASSDEFAREQSDVARFVQLVIRENAQGSFSLVARRNPMAPTSFDKALPEKKSQLSAEESERSAQQMVRDLLAKKHSRYVSED